MLTKPLRLLMVLLTIFWLPVTPTWAQQVQRIPFSSISPALNTGMDYSSWMTDSLNQLIPDCWNAVNNQYVNVSVLLQKRCKITKLALYDYKGVFTTYPDSIYAVDGSTKTLLAVFTGPNYMVWDSVFVNTPVYAQSIVIAKYGNNVPQKIKVFGIPDTLATTTTTSSNSSGNSSNSTVSTPQHLRFIAITPSVNTGMDYTPWFSDSVDTLVQNCWNSSNNQYIDVVLQLKYHSTVTKLSLYDYTGTFTDKPDTLYAVNGTQRTLLGTFTGPNYMVWDDIVPTSAVEADAIIVRKYGNSIPQKVFIYGYQDTTKLATTIAATTTTASTGSGSTTTTTYTKIPVDGKRWYQLDNVSNDLSGLFDGITTVGVNTGYGKLISNFDAVYPLLPGEQISLSMVKFFNYTGNINGYPMTLYAINHAGQRVLIGSYTGGYYNTWLGPYPTRNLSANAQFMLDSTMTDITALVINSWGGYPTEMELYGTYTAPTAQAARLPRSIPLKQYFGVNAFEWNFEGAYGAIDESMITAMKSFTQVRHYIDWQKLEATQGSYTFNPTNSGGWNYDAIYQRCKAEGIDVLADIKTMPVWMGNSYPDSLKDAENVPVLYGKDFADPNSYIEQAKVAFQFAARYGSNTAVDSTLLSVNTTPRWTADPVNTVKKGLGLIKYMECDNERDKWWKGRKAYQTAWEYAANLSAFYDGNKNTMGAGVGVKNADPNMQVVIGGLASADPTYIRGMVDWCRMHRGYKADGSVNLCWDVINYHYYSNNSGASQSGTATRGSAPEVAGGPQKAQDFINMAHQIAGDMPVWVTETGYDINQGSPYKAIAIGSKTALQTEADWALRTSLMYARLGVERVFFFEIYDDNPGYGGAFATSGLLDSVRHRRPAADYMYQTKKLFGQYSYKETLNSDPIVDHYDLNGSPAYVLYIPDETGRTATYNLDLGTADSAKVYTPTAGADSMSVQRVATTSGKLNVTVTETPQFVVPFAYHVSLNSMMVNSINNNPLLLTPVAQPDAAVTTQVLAYPSPAQGNVTISLQDASRGTLKIRVINATDGKVVAQAQLSKIGDLASQTFDLSKAAPGVYAAQLSMGNHTWTKKLVKVN